MLWYYSGDDADQAAVVGTLPYMCDRCGRSFGYKTDLQNHMYTSHSRRRAPVYICSFCSRQFYSTSHLASHERTHTGDRPFTCDTCGKQFTQSGSLNVHRRSHDEPQPFPCHVCGQRFASRQYAKKHFAMRHSSTSQVSADVVASWISSAIIGPYLWLVHWCGTRWQTTREESVVKDTFRQHLKTVSFASYWCIQHIFTVMHYINLH